MSGQPELVKLDHVPSSLGMSDCSSFASDIPSRTRHSHTHSYPCRIVTFKLNFILTLTGRECSHASSFVIYNQLPDNMFYSHEGTRLIPIIISEQRETRALLILTRSSHVS